MLSQRVAPSSRQGSSMYGHRIRFGSRHSRVETRRPWLYKSWRMTCRQPPMFCRQWLRGSLLVNFHPRVGSAESLRSLRRSLKQLSNRTLLRLTSLRTSLKTFKTSKCSLYELRQVWWSMIWTDWRRTTLKCSKRIQLLSMNTRNDSWTTMSSWLPLSRLTRSSGRQASYARVTLARTWSLSHASASRTTSLTRLLAFSSLVGLSDC